MKTFENISKVSSCKLGLNFETPSYVRSNLPNLDKHTMIEFVLAYSLGNFNKDDVEHVKDMVAQNRGTTGTLQGTNRRGNLRPKAENQIFRGNLA